MFTTTTPVADESGTACEAALAAVDFHRRHGKGLCDLLDLLADEVAFDALCDLHGQFGAALPDAPIIKRALRTIEAALAARNDSDLDDLSIRNGYCVGTAARWYGARISDLLAAFR